jgi:ankyrin repeat protein
MSAAQFDRVGAAEALLDAGANIERRTKRGRTALMIAAMNGNVDNVRLLLQRGASVNVRDEDDRSALAHARNDDERARIIALLTKAGAQ